MKFAAVLLLLVAGAFAQPEVSAGPTETVLDVAEANNLTSLVNAVNVSACARVPSGAVHGMRLPGPSRPLLATLL